MSERIKKIFETKGKKLVTFTTGGDPDLNTSLEILKTIINNIWGTKNIHRCRF